MKVKYRKHFSTKEGEKFLSRLKRWNASYSVRSTQECTDVIMGDTQYIFANNDNFPRNKIFLFNLVKREALSWLENNTFEILQKRNTIHYNEDYDVNNEDVELIGIDLNHAYWRIAYVHGIISQKTYERGLDVDSKKVRLATLSVLGREKSYDIYEKGVKKKTIITQKANPTYRSIFKYIRRTCLNLMYEISVMLGDDFFCWKTDCIYFVNNEKNVKMVKDFLEERSLTYKVLTY